MGVVVPAAGAGARLGAGTPKALRLLRGEALLVHAVRALRASPEVGQVVVAAPPDAVAEVTVLLQPYDVTVVAGGASRQASVAEGLRALGPGVDLVLVHDAARCLTPPDVVTRVVSALRAGAAAAVPGVRVADTVKEVAVGGAGGAAGGPGDAPADGPAGGAAEVVVATVDRDRLRAVQTPQGFRREVLELAHAGAPDAPATDDAALVERTGARVVVVAGSPEAFKVTTPVDLELAEAVLARRAQAGSRHPASLEARA